MSEKKYNWHKIADSIEAVPWQENRLAIVEVAGKTMTLSQFEGQVHACTHKCPHAGGVMANGFIDATGNIVCPLHRYRFNLENGRNTSGEGYYLKTYPIETRPDGLYLGIQAGGFLNW
jgi:3-phenylpropionate/trans-cinnamate dioxygenase ferredoxin subunit